MSHPRTEIRLAVANKMALFVDKKQKIFLSRPNPLFLPEPPVILVYFREEPAKVIVGSENFPKAYERTMVLNIDMIIEGCEDPDTELDRLGLQVEQCFFDEPTFGKLCYGSTLVSTVPISIEGEGDRSLECQRLTWSMKYQSDAYLTKRLAEFLEFNADITTPVPEQFLIGSYTKVRVKWPSSI